MSSFTVNSSNPNQKWRMLALIWLVYACFGITVGSFPPLVSFISKDLDLSSTEMGLVLGAWQLVYIFTASPIGTLIDKHGVRKSVTICMLIFMLSLVVRTFACDCLTIFITVGLFGIGGPIISIGAPKVVSEWFDGKERGFAAGVYTTAPLAGVAIAIATAIAIANSMIKGKPEGFESTISESEPIKGARGAFHKGVNIHSARMPGKVAYHEAVFGALGQTLKITHESINRESFMPGVLMATRYVMNRSGLTLGLEKIMGLE
mgnify:CR=1 FL=1